MFVSSMNFYVGATCPKCKSKNYIYSSHSHSDCTGIDDDAIECWNCSQVFYLGDKDTFKDMYECDFEEEDVNLSSEELIRKYAFITKGKQQIGN